MAGVVPRPPAGSEWSAGDPGRIRAQCRSRRLKSNAHSCLIDERDEQLDRQAAVDHGGDGSTATTVVMTVEPPLSVSWTA